MSDREHGFVSEQPGGTWEQGLIAGNGVLGALVLGQTDAERIIVNRAGLFMPFWPPVSPVPTRDALPELRDLLRRGHYRRAAERVIELDASHDRAGDRWTDPLIPACELSLRARAGTPTSYARSVDFDSGLVSVRFATEHGVSLRRLFVSRPDNVVVVVSLTAPDASVDCDLSLTETPAGSPAEAERKRDGIGPVETSASESWLRLASHFLRSWPGSLRGHVALARVSIRGGSAEVVGTSLQVRGASEVLLLLGVALVHDRPEPVVAELERHLAGLEPQFEQLM